MAAAARLGLDVTVLTDQPDAHRRTYPEIEILECDVRDFRAVVSRISTHRTPDAVFTNSDHLQTQGALAAAYFGLPGKDWRATLRCKDKAEMRRRLATAGVDTVVRRADRTGRARRRAVPVCDQAARGCGRRGRRPRRRPEDLVSRSKEIL